MRCAVASNAVLASSAPRLEVRCDAALYYSAAELRPVLCHLDAVNPNYGFTNFDNILVRPLLLLLSARL